MTEFICKVTETSGTLMSLKLDDQDDSIFEV